MRPGNKSLFLGQNKSKVSFHLSPKHDHVNECLHSHDLKMYDFHMRDLQSVFRMVHNLHNEEMIFSEDKMEESRNSFSKDLHLRSYLTFEMAWRSSLLCQDEWWPACRERDIILMLQGARRLECMEVQLTWADIREYDGWITYLLDLLGFPQLHR